MRILVVVIAMALISFLVQTPSVRAETPAQKWGRVTGELSFLKTHDGFLFWFGAMAYQSNACAAPLPEAAIDAFAKQAGVSKKEAAEQGPGSPFAEGYQSAMLSAKRRGLQLACQEYRAKIEEMREKGLF
jgi:hypothetical protein